MNISLKKSANILRPIGIPALLVCIHAFSDSLAPCYQLGQHTGRAHVEVRRLTCSECRGMGSGKGGFLSLCLSFPRQLGHLDPLLGHLKQQGLVRLVVDRLR